MIGPSAQNPLHPVITTFTLSERLRSLSSVSSLSLTLNEWEETHPVPAQIIHRNSPFSGAIAERALSLICFNSSIVNWGIFYKPLQNIFYFSCCIETGLVMDKTLRCQWLFRGRS